MSPNSCNELATLLGGGAGLEFNKLATGGGCWYAEWVGLAGISGRNSGGGSCEGNLLG